MSKQPPPAPTASEVGPCPTLIQCSMTPGTECLPKRWPRDYIINSTISSLLKRQTKIAADDILMVYFYLSKKIRLNISCDSSA